MKAGYVNPLDLKIRPGIQEMPLESIRTENDALNNLMSSKLTVNTMKNNTSYYKNRVRRENIYSFGSETYTLKNGKHVEVVKMVNCCVHSFDL